MKKLMLFAALLVATAVNAQREIGTITLQPKIGGGICWLTNTPNLNLGIEYDGKIEKSVAGGALLGLELEYQMTDIVSLAAGVNYSLQGSGWKDTDIIDGGVTDRLRNLEIELGYVNVPIVANVYFSKGLAVKAGVQFGFLTSAKAKFELNGNSKDFSVKSECNKFDFSIPVGISYEFNTPIVLDLRYIIGVTKVNKEKEPDGDMRNNFVQLTVGYRFNL